MAAQGSPLYSSLTAYNSNQNLLAQNSGASASNYNASVQISVTTGKRYYVQAAGFTNNSGSTNSNNGTLYNATGAYVLKFTTARAARAYPDTFATAQSIRSATPVRQPSGATSTMPATTTYSSSSLPPAGS